MWWRNSCGHHYCECIFYLLTFPFHGEYDGLIWHSLMFWFDRQQIKMPWMMANSLTDWCPKTCMLNIQSAIIRLGQITLLFSHWKIAIKKTKYVIFFLFLNWHQAEVFWCSSRNWSYLCKKWTASWQRRHQFLLTYSAGHRFSRQYWYHCCDDQHPGY